MRSVFILLYFIILNGFFCYGLERNKRYLYFPYGGSFKLVLGIGVPIKIPPRHFNLVFAQNIQFQYPQLTNLSEIQGGLPPVINRRRRYINGKSEWSLTYMAIEALLNKYGINGKACLLRAICDNAMHSLNHDANGLYGELLHILLTPNYENEDDTDVGIEYFDAKTAGEFGVDCMSLYPDCPMGHGILDTISILEEN